MTSPIGGGSEHVSRYRALGEFDNLIRAAREARRALRELREEESKLNAQSLADDKKITASKQARTKAEKDSADSARRAVADLGKNNATAGRAGEETGTSYSRGVGQGIQKSTQSGENKRFVDAATNALKSAFAKAGEDSGSNFQSGFGKTLGKSGSSSALSTVLAQRLKDMKDQAGSAGQDTGNRYIMGFASKIRDLNIILPNLGIDKLDLDVDVTDAQQSMKAIELELRRLSNQTAEPRVRIDSTRALTNLRAIQKLFKDEIADDMVKESIRIQDELRKLDELPSGKSFKFWTLTALADMSRVFSEAERGTSVFARLRAAIAASSNDTRGGFFRTLMTSFDDLSETSSKLLQRLGRVSGELYRMPGVIAVLVSSLPALIAGMGALVGGAGALASGFGALSGFLAAGPGLFAALGTGVFATASVFGSLGEALKAAKKAQEAEAEAKEKARLGTEKALTPQQKYKALLEDMAPATEKVTIAFADFGDKFADMQKQVGERFFKQVVNDMDSLNKTLPILKDLLGESAEAIGRLTSKGLQMVTSGPWKRDFAIIADENAKNITNMGTAGLSLANVFRNILVAAAPFTRWVTDSLKEGAKAFEDWSAQARSDGTITDFLNEAQESGKILWQILKNLGNVVNSFFQTTVDEGQRYMSILEGITGRWAEVMEAQEEANSPLRKWMTDIRPLLSALGDLIKAVAVGIAGLASDQRNITTMIALLDTLRTDVLPPILDIIQHLNDSGIAVTVTKALGEILEAIATFLDSGATQALTVFVTVLAEFFTLLANIASLPGVSNVLGGVAAALAALAAVSIVARFTGLFKLWDFFTWMTRNRGNLTGAFTDAARGAAGLQTGGREAVPNNAPSTIIAGTGGIGSEVIAAQTRATEDLSRAQAKAATTTGRFGTAMRGLRSGVSSAGAAIGSAAAALGPWGLAIGAATAALMYFMQQSADQEARVQTLTSALGGLNDKYDELARTGEQAGSAADSAFRDIVKSNPELQETVLMLDKLGVSFDDMVDAATGGNPAEVISAIDKEMRRLDEEMRTPGNFFQIFDNENRQDRINELQAAKDAFIANAEALGISTDAMKLLNAQEKRNNDLNNAFANFVGPVSEGMRQRLAAQYDSNAEKIDALQGLVNVLSDAEATAADKADALRRVIKSQTTQMERANEATEDWNTTILDLRDALNEGSGSLKNNTREGLRNRDALQEAARATRDLYLEDIAAGVPMDEATRRHKERTEQLIKEAEKSVKNKEEARKLIEMYGKIPETETTVVSIDGVDSVQQQLTDLKALQASLQSGKSLTEAKREVEQNKAQANMKGWGDGYGEPGFKTGGPVWGQGTRNSDSIRAWLSNGEFVQPTDAVEHYGMPIMEALRTRKLDKAALNEALPDGQTTAFANGGAAHSNNCPSCSSGGHKFVTGGRVDFPFPVNVRKTLIDKDWAEVGSGPGGLGQATGSGGVAWMMSALRKQFPGLGLISGYRPGSTTLSGNRSYHSLNRAVDLAPRRDVASWIRANYGAKTKELITPFQDLNLHNGRPHRYTGAIWNQHNFSGGNAHNHWAYNKGGLVDVMKALNLDNLGAQQQAPLPTTPRTLSPAASSVVNNTTESGTNFGDIIINNPQQERAGDSVRNALFRTMNLV